MADLVWATDGSPMGLAGFDPFQETVLFDAAEELGALAVDNAFEGMLGAAASGSIMASALTNLVQIGTRDQREWNAAGNVRDPEPWGKILPTNAAWENNNFEHSDFQEQGGIAMAQKKKQKPRSAAPKSQGKKGGNAPSNPGPNVLSVSQPAAKGVVSRSSKPQMTQSANGVRVRHREYLGDVTSTGTGYVLLSNLMLSAASPGSFPWLSTIAERYEEYTFRKMALEYVSEASTATSGVVMIGFDRTAGRSGPSSKAAFLQDQDALRVPPWQSTRMQIACDGVKRFCGTATRSGTSTIAVGNPLTSGNVDPKTVAIGNLFIATSGVAAATVGEVYIDYEVELRNPVLTLPPSSWLALNITSMSSPTAPFTDGATAGTMFGNIVALTTATTLAMQLSGNVIINMTSPTTVATASTTVTTSAGTLTSMGASIETGGFTAAWTLTGISGPTTVTLTMSSFTNLTASAGFPLKLRVSPFDRTLTSFTS